MSCALHLIDQIEIINIKNIFVNNFPNVKALLIKIFSTLT